MTLVIFLTTPMAVQKAEILAILMRLMVMNLQMDKQVMGMSVMLMLAQLDFLVFQSDLWGRNSETFVDSPRE